MHVQDRNGDERATCIFGLLSTECRCRGAEALCRHEAPRRDGVRHRPAHRQDQRQHDSHILRGAPAGLPRRFQSRRLHEAYWAEVDSRAGPQRSADAGGQGRGGRQGPLQHEAGLRRHESGGGRARRDQKVPGWAKGGMGRPGAGADHPERLSEDFRRVRLHSSGGHWALRGGLRDRLEQRARGQGPGHRGGAGRQWGRRRHI
eukprot:scaffold876_cov243-Pinguiococcus_pyrenoidosus.AAC.23